MRPFDTDGDECVCAFNKIDGVLKKRINIGVICARTWMYESTLLPTNFVEKTVTHPIEAGFWPIRNRILAGSVKTLTRPERKKILRYIVFQDGRTHSAFSQQEQIAEYMTDLIEELGANRRFRVPATREEAREVSRHAMLSAMSGNPLSTRLPHLTLRIVKSTGRPFILGDDPVIRDNPIFSAAWGRWNGYRSPGVEVFMPISAQMGILLFCTKTIERLDGLTRSDPTKLGPEWRAWLETDLDGYALRGSFRMDFARDKCERYLRSGLVIDVDDKFVDDKNRGALTLASRWIIGEKEDDLSFIDAAIASEPELREPPMADGEAMAMKTLVPVMIHDFMAHAYPGVSGEEAETLRQFTFERIVRPAMERVRLRWAGDGERRADLILRNPAVPFRTGEFELTDDED